MATGFAAGLELMTTEGGGGRWRSAEIYLFFLYFSYDKIFAYIKKSKHFIISKIFEPSQGHSICVVTWCLEKV